MSKIKRSLPEGFSALQGDELDGEPNADVVIEVRGGVAEVVKRPENITVQIIDYDNEEDE